MIRRIAIAVAFVGAAGELLILRHFLVNSYPFKVMTYPPPEFYDFLGNLGSLIVAVVALLLASVLIRRPRAYLLLPTVLTFAVPLLYATLLFASTAVRYGFSVPSDMRNFDGYTVGQASSEFAKPAFYLAIAGLVVGGLWSVGLSSVNRRQRGTAV